MSKRNTGDDFFDGLFNDFDKKLDKVAESSQGKAPKDSFGAHYAKSFKVKEDSEIGKKVADLLDALMKKVPKGHPLTNPERFTSEKQFRDWLEMRLNHMVELAAPKIGEKNTEIAMDATRDFIAKLLAKAPTTIDNLKPDAFDSAFSGFFEGYCQGRNDQAHERDETTPEKGGTIL